MIIGRSKCPRAFLKKSSQELRYDYHANSKAWMTRVLFFSRLLNFNASKQKFSSGKVLLLLDKCTAHGNANVLPALSNVIVRLFSLNKTSRIQPRDAGIVMCMKTLFKRKLLTLVLDSIDANKNGFYIINFLTAMRLTTDCWNSTKMETIRHCGEHFFKGFNLL